MVFLYNRQPAMADDGKEEHSNFLDCDFQGLGKAGRAECRAKLKAEKEAEKETDTELTQAIIDIMKDTDTGAGTTDYTPLIIGGILLLVLVLVGGFFLIKKTVKK